MNKDQIANWLRTRGLSKESESMLQGQLKNATALKNFRHFISAVKANHHIVYMECFPSHFISISVDSAKLKAYLTLIAFQTELFRVKTKIEGAATALGLINTMIDQELLAKVEETNFMQEPMLQSVFLEGVAPIPAKPAEAKLLVKAMSDRPQYTEKDDGSVDFTDLNLFENVIAEQHIADHIPPMPGVPGTDIYGALLSSHQIAKDMVMCGSGVLFDERQQKYYAAKSGYVSLSNGKIDVEDTYVVERNVDFRVGNVNFISNVRVKGDVLPDFAIQAGGNLEILGTVSGAALQVEKDLKLALGVLGQGKSHIRVGGKASMKFINETNIEVVGPIEIYKEALNARISCLDHILAQNAVVIGGRIVGLKSMHLGSIGSELGLKTQIFLGEDFNTLSRAEDLYARLMEKKEHVDMLFEQHQRAISNWQFDRLKEIHQIEKLDKLKEELELYREELKRMIDLHEELEALSLNPTQDRQPECYISGVLYPGATFFCSGASLTVKEKMKGPLRVYAERENEKKKYKIYIETKR